MNFNDRKISGSTPLKDFPERYNGLISDLNSTIKNLEKEINEKNIMNVGLRRVGFKNEKILSSRYFGQFLADLLDNLRCRNVVAAEKFLNRRIFIAQNRKKHNGKNDYQSEQYEQYTLLFARFVV